MKILIVYFLMFSDGYTVQCLQKKEKPCGIEYDQCLDGVTYICTSPKIVKVKIIKEVIK